MNRYHESMEHCAPPPELEEQLREAVLSAEPEPQARTAVYRPRGFFRKALLAAVLAEGILCAVLLARRGYDVTGTCSLLTRSHTNTVSPFSFSPQCGRPRCRRYR